VRAALDRRTAKRWLPGAFEVCELHVHPDHQSRGLGRQLLHALLAGLPHPAALLSTPDNDTKAFRLYHADGFVDLARNHRFPGDSRPFAILGARLPLSPPAPGPDRT
jgi:ribosomal protein S18 acetylase RimI-like enzyme